MYSHIIRALLITALSSCFCFPSPAQEISPFLEDKGAKVSKDYILDNISYFLDSRFRKKEIFWYEGSITTNEGVCYEGLQLKFNTIDNALYLKREDQFHRLSPYSLHSFTLVDEGRQRRFMKGFGKNQEYTLIASFRANPTEVLKYLADFEHQDSFQLTAFSTSWKPADGGSLAIRIKSSSNNPVYKLQRYLAENQNFHKIKLDSEKDEIDGQAFFEILVTGDQGKLLKMHSKKLARSGGLSLVKTHKVITFDEHDYYLANRSGEIRQVFFTKKALKKAMKDLAIQAPKRLPSVRNEDKLAACLRQLL